MRVAMFDGPGQPLAIRFVPDPAPAPDQVVVKVGRCGICSSDLHMTEGHGFTLPAGAVPGHEFSGEVVAVGAEVRALRSGDRVSVLPALSCGRCGPCLAGKPFACELGSRTLGVGETWGGYAEYAIAAGAGCLRLPDGLTLDDGALIEPLAVGLHGVRMGRIGPGDRVVVIGAGPVGLAAIYWARRAGAATIAVAARSSRGEALARRMGCDLMIVPEPGEPAQDAIIGALGGRADIVLECAGAPDTLDLSIACVKRGGMVVVMGICAQPETITPLPAVLGEVVLRFAFAFDRHEFQTAIDALDRGWVEPRAMVTGSVSLDETPQMFEALRSPGTHCKVMIDPSR